MIAHGSPLSILQQLELCCLCCNDLGLCCSITYNFNTTEESFEWYDLRNRKQEECKLLKGRIDVLAKSDQPASVQASSQNGHKAVNKQGIHKFSYCNADDQSQAL